MISLVKDERSWRRSCASLHYWVTFALGLLLLPLGALTRLTFGPPAFLIEVVAKVVPTSLILAALLHLVDTPLSATIKSLRVRPERLLMLAGMASVFVILIGWSVGLFFAAVISVIVEFFYRTPKDRLRTIRSFLMPSLYVLTGITLVFYYNDIIASVRFPGSYDPAYMRMDSWFGVDVPALSKWTAASHPRVLVWAEQLYFHMFDIFGATLILIALHGGLTRGLQYVGGVLTAYYIALTVFALFPSQGPYFLCVDHASTFPKTLVSYGVHMSLLAQAREMWQHTSPVIAPGGYFIAFPSMHVVKPALALWFLRDRKRIASLLIAYLIALPMAMLLLEMHYFVDILGGFAIAAFVIFMTSTRASIPARAAAAAA